MRFLNLGWNLGSGAFSAIANDEESRSVFVETAVEFLLKHKFDGLDLEFVCFFNNFQKIRHKFKSELNISWEYPGSRDGSDEADKESFTTLLKVNTICNLIKQNSIFFTIILIIYIKKRS